MDRPPSVPLSGLEQVVLWRRLLNITQEGDQPDREARTDALPGRVVDVVKDHGCSPQTTGSRVSCGSWQC